MRLLRENNSENLPHFSGLAEFHQTARRDFAGHRVTPRSHGVSTGRGHLRPAGAGGVFCLIAGRPVRRVPYTPVQAGLSQEDRGRLSRGGSSRAGGGRRSSCHPVLYLALSLPIPPLDSVSSIAPHIASPLVRGALILRAPGWDAERGTPKSPWPQWAPHGLGGGLWVSSSISKYFASEEETCVVPISYTCCILEEMVPSPTEAPACEMGFYFHLGSFCVY